MDGTIMAKNDAKGPFEVEFRKFYSDQAKKWNLDPNPDDPRHHYDYRKAYKAGARPDKTGHWPSKYKEENHPNRFVKGEDTITGKKMTKFQKMKQEYKN
jgi:hypothetical protein